MKKDNDIDVSIIIPVYNTASYLERCLGQIREIKNIKIEIICIDDGSTDDSLFILKKYEEADTRIHVYESNVNRGQSYARNVGMANSHGKYVLFLDSDDWMEPEGVEKIFFIAKENGLDVLLFNFDVLYEDSEFKKRDSAKYLKKTDCYKGVFDGVELFEKFHESGEQVIAVCLMLCSRKYLEEKKISFFEGVIHEDFLFYPEVILQARRTMYLQDVVYHYCRRKNSTSSDMSTNKRVHRLKSYVIIYCELFRFLKKNNFIDKNAAIVDYLRETYNVALQSYLSYCQSNDGIGVVFDDFIYGMVYETMRNAVEGYYTYDLLLHIDKIKKAKTILVYGAGMVAEHVVIWLARHDIHDFRVVVSDGEQVKYFYGNHIEYISQYVYQKDECFVIVAAKGASQEMLKILYSYGFKHYVIAGKGGSCNAYGSDNGMSR